MHAHQLTLSVSQILPRDIAAASHPIIPSRIYLPPSSSSHNHLHPFDHRPLSNPCSYHSHKPRYPTSHLRDRLHSLPIAGNRRQARPIYHSSIPVPAERYRYIGNEYRFVRPLVRKELYSLGAEFLECRFLGFRECKSRAQLMLSKKKKMSRFAERAGQGRWNARVFSAPGGWVVCWVHRDIGRQYSGDGKQQDGSIGFKKTGTLYLTIDVSPSTRTRT